MSQAIDGATALVGVLGDPVRHSLSPLMHNAALAELDLNWAYLALPVPAADLAGALRALEALGCRGLNVTLPHKQAAAALAADLSPLARRLGAVNTLVRRDGGGWWGTNTDVEGFLSPLLADPNATGSWHGKRALVLGCGGSARAVVAGALELGLASIAVAGRSPTRLASFLADARTWMDGQPTSLDGLAWEGEPGAGSALGEALAGADLVIHTTPVGMASTTDPGAIGRAPLGPDLLDQLPPSAVVYDLIYTPRPTRLLREASSRGCRVVDGLEMLVQQGAASLRLWSGLDAVPVGAMRRAALARLEGP
jgi:shikimate dehydrogenase